MRALPAIVFAVSIAAMPVSPALAQAPAASRTLFGAPAQKSPQADVFIAYENALIDGGLEAAKQHASPAKIAEIEEAIKAWGLDGFRQMQAMKKRTRVAPDEQRRRIRSVMVSGDYAYLEADSGDKGVLDVAGFEKTAAGWKVAPVRR